MQALKLDTNEYHLPQNGTQFFLSIPQDLSFVQDLCIVQLIRKKQ